MSRAEAEELIRRVRIQNLRSEKERLEREIAELEKQLKQQQD